jgi:hypothetical protein
MLYRVAVILVILFVGDAYFFRGRYVAAGFEFAQNFGGNINSGISQFTRRLQ